MYVYIWSMFIWPRYALVNGINVNRFRVTIYGNLGADAVIENFRPGELEGREDCMDA